MSARARLLTTSGAFILAVAAYSLLALAPAAAATPRVLAIRFGPDLEVNPVTKDYLNHQLPRQSDRGRAPRRRPSRRHVPRA